MSQYLANKSITNNIDCYILACESCSLEHSVLEPDKRSSLLFRKEHKHDTNTKQVQAKFSYT